MINKIFLSFFPIFLLSSSEAQWYEIPNMRCYEPGKCIQSNLLKVEPVQDQDDCILKCRGEQKCEYFTYRSDRKFCYLFDGCQKTDVSVCGTCLTGFRECPLSSECNAEGRCEGILINDYLETTANACLQRCKTYEENDSYCGWFTFQIDLELCLLYDDCLQLDKSCKTCISGKKECQPINNSTY